MGTPRSDPSRRFRRVSSRVSLRWHRTTIDANRRKPTKEDESAKFLGWRGLREKSPSSLGFPEIGEKNPCLPAKFDPRVGTSRNLKIHKHFIVAITPSPMRMPFSQPDPNSQHVLLSKFGRPYVAAGRVTFSSAISIRKLPAKCLVMVGCWTVHWAASEERTAGSASVGTDARAAPRRPSGSAHLTAP